MSDTIGFGDDGPSPRRRHLGRAAGVMVVVVAVAAVVVPMLQRHRAAADAAWVQRQWSMSTALDDARQVVAKNAFIRTGLGDSPRYVRVVATAETEEADRLTAVRDAVRRRSGRGVNGRAADAVARADAALIADLRRSARSPTVDERDGAVPDPVTEATTQAMRRATAAVAAAARAKHLRAVPPPRVRLARALTELAVLLRVTDQPVDLRFVLGTGLGLTLWDLRVGRGRHLALDAPPSDLALYSLGDSVFSGGDGSYDVVPLDGSPARPVPPDDVYLAGSDRLWLLSRGGVRRYDSSLTPTGPWRRLPDLQAPPVAATADALVLERSTGDELTRTSLWWPRSGRSVLLSDDCTTGVAVARNGLAFGACDRSRIEVLDGGGNRVATLRPPPGYLLDAPIALSGDGHHLAVTVLPVVGDAVAGQEAQRVVVFDVHSGQRLLLSNSAAMSPLGWSADGSVLLAGPASSQSGSSQFPLAYCHFGEHTLHAIRIDGSYGFLAVTPVP